MFVFQLLRSTIFKNVCDSSTSNEPPRSRSLQCMSRCSLEACASAYAIDQHHQVLQAQSGSACIEIILCILESRLSGIELLSFSELIFQPMLQISKRLPLPEDYLSPHDMVASQSKYIRIRSRDCRFCVLRACSYAA